MKIERSAVAGTLESSDCLITLEPGDGSITVEIESTVLHQFGNQIRHVVYETLGDLDITSVHCTVVDHGALDCTIRARIEGAYYRSVRQLENIPWGGMIHE